MPLTIGTNPDAWGVWTPEDQRRVPWEQWLDDVASAGYRQIELGSVGYLPTEAARVRHELDRRGLSLTAGYVGRLTPDPRRRESIMAQLRQVGPLVAGAGGRFLVAIAGFYRDDAGRVDGPTRLDADDWQTFIGLIGDLTAVAGAEFGLRIAYHPHIDTVVEAPNDIERLLVDTGDDVGLCLDTGQMAYRGNDPVEVLHRWAGRVTYLHLRDLDPVATATCQGLDLPFEQAVRRGLFCDPGTGLIDFAGLVRAVADVDFDGPVIVERSLLGSLPHEAAAAAVRARRYYESIGLVAPAD